MDPSELDVDGAELPQLPLRFFTSLLGGEAADPLDVEGKELRNEGMRLSNEKLRRELEAEAPREPLPLGALADTRADYVILGPRGSGKTITLEALADAYRERGWNVVRYLYGPRHLKKCSDIPDHSFVMIDETAVALAEIRGCRAPEELCELLALARHRDVCFGWVGQHSHMIHPEILRFEFRLGVKAAPMRQLLNARPELIDDLKRARRDLAFLPRSKAVTHWSLEDETTCYTMNGPGPWLQPKEMQ